MQAKNSLDAHASIHNGGIAELNLIETDGPDFTIVVSTCGRDL